MYIYIYIGNISVTLPIIDWNELSNYEINIYILITHFKML